MDGFKFQIYFTPEAILGKYILRNSTIERLKNQVSFIEFCGYKNSRFVWRVKFLHLGTLSTDATGQLDVLGHNGDTLGMDGAQVGVLEKSNQVSLRGFLEGLDCGSLETQVSLEVLSDLTDKTLEGQLSDEKLSGFLVSSDLSKSNCSWSVSVWFLDSTSGWGTLASGLGSQLFSWSFSTSGFSCSLLGTGHFCLIF